MASEERHFPRLIMKYCGTTRLPIGELKRQLAKPTQGNYKLPPPQQPGFLKNFNLKSSGYSSAPFLQGYEPIPTSSTLYNQPGLECPACTMGPPNRTRFTIAPF
jgi:hypothetical protein